MSYRIYVEFYLKGKNSSSSIGLDETYATKECAYSMLHSLAKAYGKQIVEDELSAAFMQGGNPTWNHYFIKEETPEWGIKINVCEEMEEEWF